MWWVLCFTPIIFWFQQVSSVEYTLPSYISVCYRNDPKVSDCLKKEIEQLLPLFKKGSKEFDLDPLDPIEFSDMVFKYSNFLIGGTAMIPKATVYGLSKIKVLNVRTKVDDPKKFVLDFDVNVDKMRIKGGYKLNGNVRIISVDMEGNMDLDLDDVDLTYHVAGTVKPGVNGSDFLYLDSFRWRHPPGKGVGNMRVVNDDFVHNQPTLNALVLAVIRSPAWRLLETAMLPAMLPQTDRNLKKTFSKFFLKYPYDVIFPKNPPN